MARPARDQGLTGAGVVLAHDAFIPAVPFVVPEFLVVGLMGAIIWRDRREGDGEDEDEKLVAPPGGP